MDQVHVNMECFTLYYINLMVLYNLVLRGRADFVEAIELPIGAMWHMTLLCISCHENFPK